MQKCMWWNKALEKKNNIFNIQSYSCTSSITRAHYSDVIMSATVSLIIGVSIVYSTFCSGADQRKHQSSALLNFMRGVHRWPVNFPHKGPVTRKIFQFNGVIVYLPYTHDVIKWKYFPRYWPFVQGILPVTDEFPAQRPVTRASMFSLIWPWINGYVNNREAGDFRRHRARYDIAVLIWIKSSSSKPRRNTTKSEPSEYFVGCIVKFKYCHSCWS